MDIGADADLIVIDPNHTDVIDAARLHSAIDYNPYQGMTVRGVPAWTVSRGEVVVEQGTPTAARGRGRLVVRDGVQATGLMV